jgi:hypothetical protein
MERLGSLGTPATAGPVVRSRATVEYGAAGGDNWQGKPKYSENSATVPHGLTWDRTRVPTAAR